MFYYSVLGRLNEVNLYSVISLKQRSTCRHVTYFETNTYVILCHEYTMEEMKEGRKTNGYLCYSFTIYMRELYILVRGDVQYLYDIHMFVNS